MTSTFKLLGILSLERLGYRVDDGLETITAHKVDDHYNETLITISLSRQEVTKGINYKRVPFTFDEVKAITEILEETGW